MRAIPVVASVLSFGLLAGCATGTDTGDSYPSGPITLVVPYATGGSTDSTSRILAEAASEYFPEDQTIVVENRPGGGSVVGLTELYNSDPDGYTLGITMETGVATKPNTENVPYEPDEFAEILTLAQSAQVLSVAADSEWETFDDVIEWATENPGEFQYGHSGVGSIAHLAMEATSSELGMETTGVPYGSSGESQQALLSGQIMAHAGAAHNLDPELYRQIVNFGSEIPGTEEVPVSTEYGVTTGVDAWIGVLAPPETPDEVVTTLHDAFKATIEDDDVTEQLANLGIAPYYLGPDDFEAEILERYDAIGKITAEIGMSQ